MKTTSIPAPKGVAPLSEPIGSIPQSEASFSKETLKESDSVTLSLPRTKAIQGARAEDPVAAAEALASSIKDSGNATAVHGGIEASRVFDLLNED